MAFDKFLEIMNEWILDDNFQYLSRYSQSRHWLDYISLKENHYSDILSWLLSPNEGHGLGDYFIKGLLTHALSKTESNEIEYDESDKLSPSNIDACSFHGAKVGREISFDGGRIDILVVDTTNDLVIVIERKDGSTLHDNQLSHYEEWINHNYAKYYQVKILSDSQNKVHELNDQWVQVDDEWLIRAIREVINNETLPDVVNYRLRDFLSYLTDEWESDPYFVDMPDVMSKFVNKYYEQIRQIADTEFSFDSGSENVALITQELGIRKCIPAINNSKNKNTDTMYLAVNLAMKHQSLLESLVNSERLESLANEIENMPGYKHKIVTETFRQKDVEYMDIGLKKYSTDSMYKDGWPLFVRVQIPNYQKNNAVQEGQIYLKAYMPFFPSEGNIRNVARKIFKINEKRKSYTVMKSEKPEYISTTSIRKYLEELLVMDSKIVVASENKFIGE